MLQQRAQTAEARIKELEADVERWQRNYNCKLLEWDKSLMKWRGIIGCGLSTNQPELLIVIDAALEQGAKDAARVKELETEVQRQKQCRERSIRLMGAKINRQRTQLNYFHAAGVDLLQVRAEKAEAALQTARADAAREERERLEPWIRHSRQCDMIQRVESYDCTCGLHESLEVKP